MHIAALPSPYGIGDMGPLAYKFIDKLKNAHQSVWQILPITPADKWGCPYAGQSSCGGDELLISPELLVEQGLISKEDLKTLEITRTDYKVTREFKSAIYKKAFSNFDPHQKSFLDFKQKHESWLEDFALFTSLSVKHGTPWTNWPEGLKLKEQSALKEFRLENQDEIDFTIFKQWLFFRQWERLKAYAHKNNVRFFGDIPIFLSHHSVDVWSHPELFKLNSKGLMEIETGVPPDDFSETGQKWGTPNYQWSIHKETDFTWWKKRLAHQLDFFDFIRLDHFIGFYHVWETPRSAEFATAGSWVKSCGKEFLTSVTKEFPNMPIIAEDLGVLCDEVVELINTFKIPGMKILQCGLTNEKSDHHPDNLNENYIYYTGTHDNDTLMGWLDELSSEEKEKISISFKDQWDLISALTKSQAIMTIIPVQDLLGLTSEARYNLPGTTIPENWSWRITPPQMNAIDWNKLKEITVSSERVL